MEYVWKKLQHDGLGSTFSVEGRIVDVASQGSSPFRDHTIALVEIEDSIQGCGASNSEGVDEDPTCSGKNGDCSRTVDEEGDRCWQHPEDDE